jgi:hypothetical protein
MKAQNDNFFIYFYFSPKVAHPMRLCGVKLTRIQEKKISHLGSFKKDELISFESLKCIQHKKSIPADSRKIDIMSPLIGRYIFSSVIHEYMI